MSYNANDLKTLSAGAAYREKLGMYLSADLQEAIDLGLRELLYNAQDEYEATHKDGSQVSITIDTKTNKIIVEDNLRGIPCSIRDDGINSLTAACLLPHSGAKHKGENAYKQAVGVNGQGMKIVCHTSSFFEIEVKRDGNIYYQSFHETDEGAVPNDDVKIIGSTSLTGTKITYIPSPTVYGKDTKIDIDQLKKNLTDLSYFTKGFKIILVVDGIKTEFYSENGLLDGLDSTLRYHKNALYFQKDYNDCSVEIAIQWNKKHGEIKPYANNLYVRDGGAFIVGFKRSLTTTFNRLANKNFSGDLIRKTLEGYVSVKVSDVQFSNQAKTALANKEAQTATSAATKEALETFANIFRDDFFAIVEVLSKEEKADKAAEKARENALKRDNEINKELKKKTILAGKLADCRYHDEKSQLIIVEGLSALGSIIKSRNSDYTAAFPLTGKILNVLKSTEDEQISNEVLKNLHTAIGAGFGCNFNMKKMRYGRIVFVCDADEDGYSIMCLLLAFMYKYYPELLRQKKVYWGQTPLFKVTTKQDKVYYAYTEKELESLPDGDILRAKGIGELEPEDFKNTLFSKEGRYIPFSFEDAEKANYYFDVLLGENIKERKEYISKNADFDAFD
jgi:DNA gyrase subunit B